MSSATRRLHLERHRTDRIGWLRAAVLGANDGIVSTASLVVGVAAAQASPSTILMTAVAGLVAGAMSMAAGEYVSVHSQADTEKADIERERHELDADPLAEEHELASIYVGRGLAPELAQKVAQQLMAHDALGAGGAALPLWVAAVAPASSLLAWVASTALVFLALLGGVAARTGGASVLVGAWRVTFWGALAMAITAGVGALFGAPVG